MSISLLTDPELQETDGHFQPIKYRKKTAPGALVGPGMLHAAETFAIFMPYSTGLTAEWGLGHRKTHDNHGLRSTGKIPSFITLFNRSRQEKVNPSFTLSASDRLPDDSKRRCR
jgi:hypothetical protein